MPSKLVVLIAVLMQVSRNVDQLANVKYQHADCVGSVPSTQEALPRWTATDKRCRRNEVDRGSCVDAAILRLISMTSAMACSPQTPDVSMATGTKSTPEMISAYFCFFFASAAAAAKPACVLLAWMCDIAYVSGQVTSQARHRPLLHGTCVTPSGRLPLLVHSECGSRVANVSALINARHSRSLT